MVHTCIDIYAYLWYFYTHTSRLLKKSICCVLGTSGILTYLLSTLRFHRSLRPCSWSFLSSLPWKVIFQKPVRLEEDHGTIEA
jgi:hypothetical protein